MKEIIVNYLPQIHDDVTEMGKLSQNKLYEHLRDVMNKKEKLKKRITINVFLETYVVYQSEYKSNLGFLFFTKTRSVYKFLKTIEKEKIYNTNSLDEYFKKNRDVYAEYFSLGLKDVEKYQIFNFRKVLMFAWKLYDYYVTKNYKYVELKLLSAETEETFNRIKMSEQKALKQLKTLMKKYKLYSDYDYDYLDVIYTSNTLLASYEENKEYLFSSIDEYNKFLKELNQFLSENITIETREYETILAIQEYVEKNRSKNNEYYLVYGCMHNFEAWNICDFVKITGKNIKLNFVMDMDMYDSIDCEEMDSDSVDKYERMRRSWRLSRRE